MGSTEKFRRTYDILVEGYMRMDDIEKVWKDRNKWLILSILCWALAMFCSYGLIFSDAPEIAFFYVIIFYGMGKVNIIGFLAHESALNIMCSKMGGVSEKRVRNT